MINDNHPSSVLHYPKRFKISKIIFEKALTIFQYNSNSVKEMEL